MNTTPNSSIVLSNIPGFSHALVGESESEFIKTKRCRFNNRDYKIISYVKSLLNTEETIRTYGALRSVVVNSENQVIGFSPPKSTPYWTFISENLYFREPISRDDNSGSRQVVVAEEFVEGIMINVFWDPCAQSFIIATKNTVGADTSFYVTDERITFSQMFYEAASKVHLDIQLLDRDYSYSFVLQHPKNILVTHFLSPALRLVAVYKIVHEGTAFVNVSRVEVNVARCCDHLRESGVLYPKRYDTEELCTYNQLIDLHSSAITPYYIQGVVFRNVQTDEHCKMRNPNFERVHRLRGNQPKSQFQYLTLRKSGSVSEFLSFYPDFAQEFELYRNQLHDFTSKLLSYYCECYIKHTNALTAFPKQFRIHMFNLSVLYKTQLKPDNRFVNKMEVIQYVNALEPEHLMYALNYEHRTSVAVAVEEEQVSSL
jgi:hypothetical protein